MKPDEWVLTIVQLAAPIFAFAVGNIPMGIFLSVWLCIFGAAELISKAKTGTTLSGHVWRMPRWQRVVLSIIMILGMVVLGYHFVFAGGN